MCTANRDNLPHDRRDSVQRPAAGSTLVVIAPDLIDGPSVWNRVLEAIRPNVEVLIPDSNQAFAAPEIKRQSEICTDESEITRRIQEAAPDASRIIFTGWGIGALLAEWWGSSFPTTTTAFVLVDSMPLDLIESTVHSERDTNSPAKSLRQEHLDALALIEDPILANLKDTLQRNRPLLSQTTVILPGVQPDRDDHLAQQWALAQREELSRCPAYREIIAGRSRRCIPLERPDVVADAILSLLERDYTSGGVRT